jgi:hypothetical protein
MMEPLAQLLALELDYSALTDADLAARRAALVDALDGARRQPNPSSQLAGLTSAVAAQLDEIDAQISKRAALAVAAQVARQVNDPAQEREWVRQNNLAYAGLIGVALVLVQPLMTATRLDVSAKISVVAFAVAIPLLAALVLVAHQEAFRRRATKSVVVAVAKAVAQGCAVIGVVAGFWHIIWIAGVAMLAGAFVALGVHSAGYTRLELEGSYQGWRSRPNQ